MAHCVKQGFLSKSSSRICWYGSVAHVELHLKHLCVTSRGRNFNLYDNLPSDFLYLTVWVIITKLGNELLHHFLVFRCEFEIFCKTFALLVVSLTVRKLHMLLNCNDNISNIFCYVLLRQLAWHFTLLVLYRNSPILDFWGLVNAKRDKNLKRLLELVWIISSG